MPPKVRLLGVRIALFIVMGLILALAPGVAYAATDAQTAPGESNLGFLFAGFAVAWAGFFAYAFYVGQKNRELRRDIEELRERLQQRESPQG